jgi:hypothetical protein
LLAAAEERAIELRRGLWAEDGRTAPWDFRHGVNKPTTQVFNHSQGARNSQKYDSISAINYEHIACPNCNGTGHKSTWSYYGEAAVQRICDLCGGSGRILASVIDNGNERISSPFVAENGSYYGELNENGISKTVYVRGYYRKDGTYVRGHYRSKK